ncbi:CU044_5270 family protein [Actinosynnema sp. NPDC047251]|uniref:Putative membrane protein n=1 Tax=Saccharothrix espanaensis (strain ATCC 51144 / DSM 44229 / JCM 9112 / NBRC 15066 / NRRL 15764) TaxID=1179773 RepID=K0KCJ7_SACES|nr:CU044_5270 family protein [Saccharothrix espanaensis]CCH35267.1 putative membrane protein [Saccharothrix espanaensis DSM 44229]
MRDLDEALDQLERTARTANAPLDDVRAQVLAAAAAEESPRRSRRTARWFLPVAVAAAAALVVGVVVTRPDGAPQPGTTAQAQPGTDAATTTPSQPKVSLLSAKQVLDDAAAAINTVDPVLAPGQYRYIAEHAWYSRGQMFGVSQENPDQTIKGWTYLKETARETWIPQDQSQDWLEKRSWLPGVKWLGGSVPQSEAPEPQAMDTDTGERRGKCGNFFPESRGTTQCGDPSDWNHPEFYVGLPRDPQAIVEYLRTTTAHRGSTPPVMFHFGVEILRAGLMPADLRAGWYRALATLDGVKVYDEAATLDGRTGIAIGLEDEQERRDLIVDPATGDFIGERSVAGPKPSGAWIPPGTVTGFSSITTKVVNGIGQTG